MIIYFWALLLFSNIPSLRDASDFILQRALFLSHLKTCSVFIHWHCNYDGSYVGQKWVFLLDVFSAEDWHLSPGLESLSESDLCYQSTGDHTWCLLQYYPHCVCVFRLKLIVHGSIQYITAFFSNKSIYSTGRGKKCILTVSRNNAL